MQGNMIARRRRRPGPASLYADLSELVDGSGPLPVPGRRGQVAHRRRPAPGAARGGVLPARSATASEIALEGGVDLNIPVPRRSPWRERRPSRSRPPCAGPETADRLRFRRGAQRDEHRRHRRRQRQFPPGHRQGCPSRRGPPAGRRRDLGRSAADHQVRLPERRRALRQRQRLLRVNSSGTAQADEVLKDAQTTRPRRPPRGVVRAAARWLRRLPHRIRRQSTASHGESVARIDGIFVLEFSAEGFNVALFGEPNGPVVARLDCQSGRPGAGSWVRRPRLPGDPQNGIAADLVLTADANSPWGWPPHADAVFIVNTTGEPVTFDIPGGPGPQSPHGPLRHHPQGRATQPRRRPPALRPQPASMN